VNDSPTRPIAKIPVVDDEPSPVATLDDNLRRDGHEVAIARDLPA
jgi:DNA-binding response OmpR family regulator